MNSQTNSLRPLRARGVGVGVGLRPTATLYNPDFGTR
jgi:hypothetical protein